MSSVLDTDYPERSNISHVRTCRREALRPVYVSLFRHEYLAQGQSGYRWGSVLHIRGPGICTATMNIDGAPTCDLYTEKRMYNQALNATPKSVEWFYKKRKKFFTTLGFARSLRVRQGIVALQYIVETLSPKFKTCAGHAAQVESDFQCTAPTLDRYTTIL